MLIDQLVMVSQIYMQHLTSPVGGSFFAVEQNLCDQREICLFFLH